MSAIIEIQNDAGEPITSYNFGAVAGGAYQQAKLIAKNVGNQAASSVSLYAQRLSANDGIDFVQIAPDVGGNPGAYQVGSLVVGDLAADTEYAFWVKVTIPTGTTPAGNPRQFDIISEYSGT